MGRATGLVQPLPTAWLCSALIGERDANDLVSQAMCWRMRGEEGLACAIQDLCTSCVAIGWAHVACEVRRGCSGVE
jgi:hypothetical protein